MKAPCVVLGPAMISRFSILVVSGRCDSAGNWDDEGKVCDELSGVGI